jgi:protein-disulfide isomerase/rhodanese-related sulfurtransferase
MTMRRFLILALSLIGLFDSVYLLWVYTSPSHPLVCLGTGCDVARASSYSHLWGLPLPLFGVAMYGALALLAFGESLGGAVLYAVIRYATLAIAAVGFIASLVLSGIEAFVLHAWCAWCVLSAVTVVLIFAFAIYGVARPGPPPQGSAALSAARGQFILFILALVVGIPAFIHLSHSGEKLPASPQPTPAALDARLVRPDSHATGDLQSSVTVVEFGDLECPMCGLAQKTVLRMLQQYGRKVRFVFRHFPLTSIHPQAEKAAEATECAGEQGKFWQAEELLYQKQPDLSVDALKRYAAQLGLDTQKFDECLSSGRMAPRIQQDIADAKALGVHWPPTFFVGHQMLIGAPDYKELSRLIDQQLADQAAVAAGAQAPGSSSAPSTSPAKLSASASSGTAAAPLGSKPFSSSNPGTTLGGGSIFSQAQPQSALACNPDEAKLDQPALIHTPEAEKLFKSDPKPLFVDVRAAQDFAKGHIPGAINIPVEEIQQKWNTLPRNQVIVFYEGGERSGSPDDVCAFSRAAARIVLSNGFDKAKVKVYQEGLKGWESASLPVTR